MDTSPLALNLALVSAGLLGFRHGFDFDHLAALSDIAAVQRNSRQAMKMGLMYALGHAAMVTVLGLGVILFQLSLPPSIDRWMEHFVGLTLLILGAYVLWSTLFQPQSPSHSPHAAHPHGAGRKWPAMVRVACSADFQCDASGAPSTFCCGDRQSARVSGGDYSRARR